MNKDDYYIKSPLQLYAEQLDNLILQQDLSNEQIEALALKNYAKNPDYMRHALKEDMKFRNRYRLNYLVGLEGQKGSGKSMLAADLCLMNGEAFNTPFKFEQLYYLPEQLEEDFVKTPNKTVHWLDEVQKKRVGMGVRRADLDLLDYEEMARKTQKCIYKCSPTLNDTFLDLLFTEHEIIRKINKTCVNCKKINECFNQKLQTQTLCNIPFNDRLGYPAFIVFKLHTYSKVKEMQVARGYYKAQMPPPEFVIKYDQHKDLFLEQLQKRESDSSFGFMKKLVKEIIEHRKEDLYLEDAKGNLKIVSSLIIEAIVYDHVGGTRTYTKGEIDVIKAMVLNELRKAERD